MLVVGTCWLSTGTSHVQLTVLIIIVLWEQDSQQNYWKLTYVEVLYLMYLQIFHELNYVLL
jgi:hypothetical protein